LSDSHGVRTDAIIQLILTYILSVIFGCYPRRFQYIIVQDNINDSKT